MKESRQEEDAGAARDGKHTLLAAVEQSRGEGAPAGLPDSAVQRSTLSHLYDDMSQVLGLSWCGEVWPGIYLLLACIVGHVCCLCIRQA